MSNKPTTPGQILKAHIKTCKTTQEALATHLGVTTATVNRLATDKTRILPGMAAKLGATFGVDPAIWLEAQLAFDTWSLAQTPCDTPPLTRHAT